MLVTFLLELAMLAAYGVWGYALTNTALRWPAAIGTPVVVGVIWGVFLSPRARVRLSYAATFAGRTMLLVGGAVILWSGHRTLAATIYTVALVVSVALTLATRRIPGTTGDE